MRESNPKYSEHFDAQKQLSERINETIKVSNEAYLKLSDLQTGPYEVIEVEESRIDYLIKKIGSSAAPVRCNIDFLNLFRTFDLPADS